MLPVVTRETALGAMCDLLRREMNAAADDDSGGPLMDIVLVVAKENPEIFDNVNLMMSEHGEKEKMAALLGMAVTYAALKAQAETEALERMGKL